MFARLIMLGACALALASFATCGKGAAVDTPPPAAPVAPDGSAPAGLDAALGAPPAARRASAGELLSLAGGSFATDVLNLRVANEHNEAVFSPALELPGGPQGLALAVYDLNLGDYAGASELYFDWGNPAPGADTWWVGVARPGDQRWAWFAQPAHGVLSLAGFDAYRYAEGGLLVAVAVVGAAQQRLYGLRVGPAPAPPDDLPLSELTLPAGFSVSVYAYPVPDARAMCLSPNGVLYVGSRGRGNVYAVRDLNGDRVAEQIDVIASGLAEPVGLDLYDGDLYVSAINRVVRLDDIDTRLDAPPAPVDALTGLATDQHHGWKFIRFGPDGKLYVPVGAPCNICDAADYSSAQHGAIPYASILRFDPDGTGMEVVARGVRNTVGFDWHPGTDELWFTDNGGDNLGDDIPPCELNYVDAGAGTGAGAPHYGYPYFHGESYPDPTHSAGRNAEDYLEPAAALGPHVAPLGVRFYRGGMFPAEYRGAAFIAEHGSWNRSDPLGARVTLVRVDGHAAQPFEIFADGWQRANGSRWGRPVDVLELPDGSLLVSDDHAGAVYRITYSAE